MIKVAARMKKLFRRQLMIGGGVFLALLVLGNIGVGIAYHDRTYPGTTVMGRDVGNVAFRDLPGTVQDVAKLPESIQLVHEEQKVTVTSAQLGLKVDIDSVRQSAQRGRSWLPIMNLLKTVALELPLKADGLAKLSSGFANEFHRDAANARLTLNQTTVGIAPDEAGYALDEALLERSILGQIAEGKTTINVPVRAIKPRVKAVDLQGDKKELEGHLTTTIKYIADNNSRVVTAAEAAAWYVQRGELFEIDDARLQAFIKEVGSEFNMRVKDVSSAAAATKEGVKSKKATVVTLSRQPPSRVFTYCVGVEGIGESYLSGLKLQLRKTFSDPRGWSMKGSIEFQEVTTGCEFTVWLAASSSVPTFSGACDTVWSCRVGPHVIINFDRWQNASPAWKDYGGTVEDYRHMVINHETGHWLGFEHQGCAAVGQKAPVMQQQSINLGGCTFNPWPTAAELQTLRSGLGI